MAWSLNFATRGRSAAAFQEDQLLHQNFRWKRCLALNFVFIVCGEHVNMAVAGRSTARRLCGVRTQPRHQPLALNTCAVQGLAWSRSCRGWSLLVKWAADWPGVVQRQLHRPRHSAPDQISTALERVKLSPRRSGIFSCLPLNVKAAR